MRLLQPSALLATTMFLPACGSAADQTQPVLTFSNVSTTSPSATTTSKLTPPSETLPTDPQVQPPPPAPKPIPEGAYQGAGFAVLPPPGWATIDKAAVDNGSVQSLLPPGATPQTVDGIRLAFSPGVVVTFYDFNQLHAGFTPNITVVQQPPKQPVDISAQAVRSVTTLQNQGFTNVVQQTDTYPAGSVITLTYTVPATTFNTNKNLQVSSRYVFAAHAFWTFTGITSGSLDDLNNVVTSTAGSLLEI